MDKDHIDDLKEYMARILSQQTYDLREDMDSMRTNMEDLRNDITEIRKDMKTGFSRLDQKIDDLSDSLSQAIDTSNEETDNQLKDHESRISKLEHASE